MSHGQDEIARILAVAGDLAGGAGQVCSTVHILLALFVQPSNARELLVEAGVDHRNLIATFRTMRERGEPASATAEVLRHAEALANRSDAANVCATSLLASLLRVRNSAAGALLREAGLDAAALRARVIGSMTQERGRDRGITRPRLRAVTASGGDGASRAAQAGGAEISGQRRRATGPRPNGLLGRLSDVTRTGEFPAWDGSAGNGRDDDDPPPARALPIAAMLLDQVRTPRRPRVVTWPPEGAVPPRGRQRVDALAGFTRLSAVTPASGGATATGAVHLKLQRAPNSAAVPPSPNACVARLRRGPLH